MHTVKTIRTGKRGLKAVVVRSDGLVYLADNDQTVDFQAMLVATTPLACFGLSEALREASEWSRENDDKLVHKQ